MSELQRIAYLSRSLLTGTPSELEVKVRRILATARVNNRKFRLTGALAFNASFFGQVLEGHIDDLKSVFERIRRDKRHTDLKVLQSSAASERWFPTWSMAYVKNSDGDNSHPLGHFAFEQALTDGATPQAEQLLGLLRQCVSASGKRKRA